MNSILKKIKSKFIYLSICGLLKKQMNTIEEGLISTAPKLFYFCVPVHPNLGDQAQYYCWLKLFTEWYPDHITIPIQSGFVNDELLYRIKSIINKNDRIYIHSGYLISDIHPETPVIKKIVDFFDQEKITILPQTINLNDNNIIEDITKVFNKHSDLMIVSRDEVSLSYARKLFSNCHNILMPDVVTSLIGDASLHLYEGKRDGILFCIRDDSEKFYSEKQINGLKNRLKNYLVDKCDTTIKAGRNKLEKNREQLIMDTVYNFSRYQVIITDRYHGTIFSQIANTPVIVLSSNDHKLSSGVKWFPSDYFSKNMHYADNLEDAYNLALMIINRSDAEYKNNCYFKEKFYSKPI